MWPYFYSCKDHNSGNVLACCGFVKGFKEHFKWQIDGFKASNAIFL
jgi:hypothetical protein